MNGTDVLVLGVSLVVWGGFAGALLVGYRFVERGANFYPPARRRQARVAFGGGLLLVVLAMEYLVALLAMDLSVPLSDALAIQAAVPVMFVGMGAMLTGGVLVLQAR